MIDEELREAERLAKAYVKKVWKDGFRSADKLPNYSYSDFVEGYTAACESLRARYEGTAREDFRSVQRHIESLEAERARSAKLIEVMKYTARLSDHYLINNMLDEAINEYEVSRD